MTERSEHGFELPEFDERAARRAIRRGVLRTAFSAVLLAFVALIILEVTSFFWQKRGDREERFQAVVGLGFLVANPGWDGEPSGCCNTSLTSLELFLDVWPRSSEPTGETTRAWLRLNLLGRVEQDSIPVLPETPVDAALSRGRPDKDATRELLSQLPEPVRAMAIVELAEPLDAPSFAGLLQDHGVPTGEPALNNSPPIFLEEPYGFDPGMGSVTKLSWPNPLTARDAAGVEDSRLPQADPLTQFQAWARMLRDGDDQNLERLGLPPTADIKRIAESPRAHGFLLERAPIERLEGLLDDPRVRSVNVADVAFDLSQGQFEGF